MQPILAGIETEYGLLVEGHGAEDQVEDSMALVRSYPDECFAGWDYRYESPRADLRGFVLDRLAFDPEDSKFDTGRVRGPDTDIRSDRILPNGARFYNDHGHPEYSTPECWSLDALVRHDKAGEMAVLRAARAFSEASGAKAWIYKNNTDFHGASYGTHEGYLVPRELGFERLFQAVTPMLVARQVLCGAGKVGSESGASCTYQLSQRADFFSESANAETLYRRPIFNTRDEPHSNPAEWIRVHVISGDANIIPSCTRRKVGLVKLALALCVAGEAPTWKLENPVTAFQSVSRDETYKFEIKLAGGSWTTVYELLEGYFAAAENVLELDEDIAGVISESRRLLSNLQGGGLLVKRHIDWAAKKAMLEHYMESEGSNWRDPSLRSFDLEYHNVDPEESLQHALQEMGEVEPSPSFQELEPFLKHSFEETRAHARGLAVSRFKDSMLTGCWTSVTMKHEARAIECILPPDMTYSAQLEQADDVGTFIQMLRGSSR